MNRPCHKHTTLTHGFRSTMRFTRDDTKTQINKHDNTWADQRRLMRTSGRMIFRIVQFVSYKYFIHFMLDTFNSMFLINRHVCIVVQVHFY